MRAGIFFWGLVALALLLGGYSCSLSLLDPLERIPAPRFAEGHLVAIELARQQLFSGTPGTSLELLGYPMQADFRPLLWPVVLLGVVIGGPLAINLAFFLIPLANAMCGWFLGRQLGLSQEGRFVLGGAVAGHPWVLETLINGQLEQAFFGGIGLIWACAPIGFNQKSHPFFLGILTLAIGLAAPHTVLVAGAGLLGFALFGKARWREWGWVLLSVGVAVLLVQQYFSPSMSSPLSAFAPKGSVQAAPGVAELPDAASIKGLFWPLTLARPEPVVHPVYLGWGLIGASLWGGRNKALWGVAVMLALLSLGVGPYWFLKQVPVVAASATPYRLVMGVVWILAILAATTGKRFVVGLCLVESLLTISRGLPIPAALVRIDAALSKLEAGKKGPVLDLPYPWNHCESASLHYALQASVHGRPIPYLLSYGKKSLGPMEAWFLELQAIWPHPDCPELFKSMIKQAGFSAVISHEHGPDCTLERPRLACVTEALGPKMLYREVRVWELDP
jgi:hypothetical protein